VYNQTITSSAQVPHVIEQAIEAALAQRGVAVLSIPGDVGPIDVDTPPVRVFDNATGSRPDDELVGRAARLIDDAAKVTILAGTGSRAARTQVLALADRVKAPIVSTLKAKDVYDWDNPFNVGQNGLIGNPAASRSFRDCDLLMMVGTATGSRTAPPRSRSTRSRTTSVGVPRSSSASWPMPRSRSTPSFPPWPRRPTPGISMRSSTTTARGTTARPSSPTRRTRTR
jgi:pyruvate dehydrogenase (quinone)